ncbi:MAG: cytochrome-c oxidase, cbb3-type subunit III [Rhizobiaceae bacterium]
MTNKEVDEFSGVNTTGHEWDGIKELDNPMPRWWLWSYYASIIFAIGYVIYYPAIPLISSYTTGISGETTRSVLAEELKAASAAKASLVAKIEATPVTEIRNDDDLLRFSVAGGRSLYKVYCTQCHGSGAQGAPGYPNLNDDDWLWGGDVETIYATIKHGVRNEEDDDARFSEMPGFGKDELLEPDEVRNVVEYILQISDRKHDAAKAEEGIAVFADNCAACHGDNGKGGREFGAPNLADALSLYGGDRAKLTAQVNAPKHGVMPAWGSRLGEASVRQLAVYIHSLGGGE